MRHSVKALEARFLSIHSQIAAAATAAGRSPDAVTLVAVSKFHPASCIAALAAIGQRDFAENYVQEALSKQELLASHPVFEQLIWHFTGPIQSNKTRAIATHFSWVHSVDRPKIAERLSAQRPDTLPPLKVFVEVNLDGESTKAGVSLAQLPAMVALCARLPRIELVGLMVIPARASTDAFVRLAKINANLPTPLPMLSMGMSADFPAAIAAGSTHVRIGTALFGAR
ncbi:MAG TPA: YggS family pyridoxal phosphate-dependent enzyme [Halothiobacillus sp.]|nr:YggS family pyridoxal phosphate-dependent enzyme [Halothiobacillus sp.]HQS28685.1 YggS family pyridoxal phosphate-dependent enzyme [Halothiobacillus sp.]